MYGGERKIVPELLIHHVQLTLIAIKVEMFYSIFPTVFFMSAPFLNSLVGSSPHVLHRLFFFLFLFLRLKEFHPKTSIANRNLLIHGVGCRGSSEEKNKKQKQGEFSNRPTYLEAPIFLRVLLLLLLFF